MPIIKSALKKMRQDAKRTERNLGVQSALKTAIKKAKLSKKFEDVSDAYSALDRAVKNNLVHKNFAARQKAQLSKLAKPVKKALVAPVKKTTKKTAPKTAKKSPAKKPTNKKS